MSAGLDRFGGRPVERDGVARLAGEALVVADRQARGRDQRHRALVAAADQHGDMRGVAGKRHPAGAAGEPAVAAERDIAVGMHRGDRHRLRPAPAMPARASSQPAIKVSASGTGAANRPAARSTAKPSAIVGAGAAELLRDPGDGSAPILRAHPTAPSAKPLFRRR